LAASATAIQIVARKTRENHVVWNHWRLMRDIKVFGSNGQWFVGMGPRICS